jgi:hypothetical protein
MARLGVAMLDKGAGRILSSVNNSPLDTPARKQHLDQSHSYNPEYINSYGLASKLSLQGALHCNPPLY